MKSVASEPASLFFAISVMAVLAAGAFAEPKPVSPVLQELAGGREMPRVPQAAASPVRGLPGSLSYERLKALYEDAKEPPAQEELDGWFAGSEVAEPNGGGYARVVPAVLVGTRPEPDSAWRLLRFVCVACSGGEFRDVHLPLIRRVRELIAEQAPRFGPPQFSPGDVRFECSEPAQRFSLKKSGRFIIEKGFRDGHPFYAIYYRDVTPGR